MFFPEPPGFTCAYTRCMRHRRSFPESPSSWSSRSCFRLALIVVFSSPLLLSTGCMSIVGNDHQVVLIETEPAGAEAVSAEGERCTTPCELRLPRVKSQSVWLEKAGFQPLEAVLTGETGRTRTAASLAGNLAFGTVVAVAGLALLFYGDQEGIALAGTGAAVALGGGAIADTYNGVLLKLTPNPLRVVLVPKVGQTEPSSEDSQSSAARLR